MTSRLRLYARLTLANLRHHRARWGLVVVGIALGLMSFTGVTAISRSIVQAFQDAVTRGAGAAQLQVTNGTAGVDANLVDELAGVAGVAATGGNVQYVVDAPSLDSRRLTIFGVQMGRDDAYRRAQLGDAAVDLPDTLEFLAQPDSIALDEAALRRHGWWLGATLDVMGPKGPRRLTVRGTLRSHGILRVFGDDVAVMDAEAVQQMFGAVGKFHWVDVVAGHGAAVDDVKRRVVDVVGARGVVDTPRGRGERIEAMLGSLRTMLATSGIVAMIVGLFLIYHTVNTAIARRQGEFATLWALGAPRRHIVGYLLLESAAVGVIGSVLGVVAGLAFARLAAASFGSVISEMYVSMPPPSVRPDVRELSGAMALGVGWVMLAAVLPCLGALRRDPATVPPRRRTWTPGLLAGASLVLFGLAVAAAHLTRIPHLGVRVATVGAVAALIFAGTTLLVPLVVDAVTLLVRRVPRSRATLLVAWTWDQVRRHRLHSTTTMGSLAAGVAFALGLTTMLGSYRAAFVDWIRQFAQADVFVNAGTTVSLLGGPTIDLQATAEVAALPGVSSVLPWRLIEVSFHGRPIIVQGMAEAMIDRIHPGLRLEHGRGEVVISDSLAQRYGLAVGDTFTVPAPRAPLSITVGAVRPDYVLDLGSVKVGWETFVRHFGEHAANILLVDAEPGMASDVGRRVAAALGGRYAVTVLTQSELRALLDTLIDQSFALTYWLEMLAVLVTVCAMINATSAAIIERADDLVTLRALGMRRRRMVRMLMIEALFVGALGSLLGLGAGTVLGRALVHTVMPAVAGFVLPLRWPLSAAATLLSLSTGAAVAAAFFIARAWTRQPITLDERTA
jgi:putative ABC transport system permease protein